MTDKNRLIFEQMEEQRKQLFDGLKVLSEDELNQQPKNGGWTIVQVIDHLRNSEQMSIDYINKKIKNPEKLKKINLLTRLKTKILYSALRLPIKFKAPKILATSNIHATFEELEASYSITRNNLQTLLNDVPDNLQKLAISKHPIIGYYNIEQSLKMFYWHFQHHISQVSRIRKEVA